MDWIIKTRLGLRTGALRNLLLDVGGVFELYPSRRTIVRFDFGDTIVRYPGIQFTQFPQGATHSKNPVFQQTPIQRGLWFPLLKRLAVNALPNKSLDRSAGSVFRNLIGAAKVECNRRARSTQPLWASSVFLCGQIFHTVLHRRIPSCLAVRNAARIDDVIGSVFLFCVFFGVLRHRCGFSRRGVISMRTYWRQGAFCIFFAALNRGRIRRGDYLGHPRVCRLNVSIHTCRVLRRHDHCSIVSPANRTFLCFACRGAVFCLVTRCS